LSGDLGLVQGLILASCDAFIFLKEALQVRHPEIRPFEVEPALGFEGTSGNLKFLGSALKHGKRDPCQRA
jgi:hypothetical protein